MNVTLTSLVGAAALLLAGAPRITQAQTYQQVWADEFTTGISSSWKFETGGGGWGNNEKQYYQAANATVANGQLQITARKQVSSSLPTAKWRPASSAPLARGCGRRFGCWARTSAA
jgi:hypothetical protein